jgi:hypothetical protein
MFENPVHAPGLIVKCCNNNGSQRPPLVVMRTCMHVLHCVLAPVDVLISIVCVVFYAFPALLSALTWLGWSWW